MNDAAQRLLSIAGERGALLASPWLSAEAGKEKKTHDGMDSPNPSRLIQAQRVSQFIAHIYATRVFERVYLMRYRQGQVEAVY